VGVEGSVTRARSTFHYYPTPQVRVYRHPQPRILNPKPL